MADPHRPPLDYAGASAYVRLSPRRLRTMVAANEIPHVRLSARTVRFLPDDLDAWLIARRVADDSAAAA